MVAQSAIGLVRLFTWCGEPLFPGHQFFEVGFHDQLGVWIVCARCGHGDVHCAILVPFRVSAVDHELLTSHEVEQLKAKRLRNVVAGHAVFHHRRGHDVACGLSFFCCEGVVVALRLDPHEVGQIQILTHSCTQREVERFVGAFVAHHGCSTQVARFGVKQHGQDHFTEDAVVRHSDGAAILHT